MLSLLTNSAANTALRNLNENSEATKSSIARMSSGSRIAKPSDDAASLAISNRLSADISSLEQAGRNAAQANSMLSVGNGAYDRIGDMLNRMKTLATQSINDTLTASERSYAQAEFDQLRTQITETAEQTRFNGQSLLTGGGGDVNHALATGVSEGASNLDNTNAAGFAGTMNAGNTQGYISGAASEASVTANGGLYDVSVTVGDQTFQATTAPTNSGTLDLVSTTDPRNVISLDYSGTAETELSDADTFETQVRNLLGVDVATKASFTSASADLDTGGNPQDAAYGDGSSNFVSAGSSTEAGQYALDYDSASRTFTLTNGNDVFSEQVDAGGAQTVTFNNGIELSLQGTFVETDDISQVTFSVSEGDNVSVNFQVGAQATDQVQFDFTASTAESLGLAGESIATVAGAESASAAIDSAIQSVNTAQAELGATMSRFEQIQGTIGTTLENLQAAKSSFNDVDMAKEMSEFTKNQTLQQASIAMLSQANQMPQQVLRLIQ